MITVLMLSVLSIGTTGLPADTRRAVASAVRKSGERSPVLSVRRASGAPAPSRGSDATYVAETKPTAFEGGCLARRYFVVIPGGGSGRTATPQVNSYGTVSFASDCLQRGTSSFAQVQPVGITTAELRSAVRKINAVWSPSSDARLRCGVLMVGLSCPSSGNLASLAPLVRLKLVERVGDGLRTVFASTGGIVTEVTVPNAESGEVTIEQRQPAPF